MQGPAEGPHVVHLGRMLTFLLSAVLWFQCAQGLQLRGGADEAREAGGSSDSSSSRVEFGKYDYLKHGEDWTAGMCFSRSRQSPIDFETFEMSATTTSGVVSYRYEVITEPFEFDNNGRVFFADVSSKGLGGLTHDDIWYDLLTISFHTFAEHTFDGHRLPMEVHLTHKRYDNDQLVMVAIPITSPDPPSEPPEPPAPPNSTAPAFLQQLNSTNVTANMSASNFTLQGDLAVTQQIQAFLWQPLPAPHSAEVVSTRPERTLDLNKLMQSGQFYEYAGSMTGPPCADTVTWLVRTQPLMVVSSQIKLFMDSIYDMNGGVGNYRAVMPLNGRIVRLFSSMQEAPVQPGAAVMTAEQQERLRPTPEPLTPEEQRMHNVAKDTMQYVNNCSDTIKEIEMRIFDATSTTAPPPTPPPLPSEEEIRRIEQGIKDAARQAVASASTEITAAVEAAVRGSVEAHVTPVRTAAAVR